MSAAVPVESGQVDHGATAGEHQWEILLYRGTAPGNGHWPRSQSFLKKQLVDENHDPSL